MAEGTMYAATNYTDERDCIKGDHNRKRFHAAQKSTLPPARVRHTQLLCNANSDTRLPPLRQRSLLRTVDTTIVFHNLLLRHVVWLQISEVSVAS